MISVVTLAAGEAWELAFLQQIQHEPHIRLCRRAVDVLDLLATASTNEVNVALVSPDAVGLDADSVFRLAAQQVQVIAVAEPHDMRRATALGIDAIIDPDDFDGIGGYLAGLSIPVEANQPPGERSDRGRLIGVWGPAGAPGRSTVALNLAAGFAIQRKSALLIDADPYGGSIAQMLGILDEVSGLLAAARAANSGVLSTLSEFAYGVGERMSVLTGLPRAGLWNQLRSGAVEIVLDHARGHADVTVIDCGFSLEGPRTADDGAPHRNQLTLQVLQGSDSVVVVGAPDPVGLTRLVRGLHELADVMPHVEPLVVINRHRPQMGWSREQVTQTVHRLTQHHPIAFLPLEQGSVDHALMAGQSLRESIPDSALTRAFTKLTERLEAWPA